MAYDAANGLKLRWIDTTLANPTINTIDVVSGDFGSADVDNNLYFASSNAGYGSELFVTSMRSKPTDLLLSNQSIVKNAPDNSAIGFDELVKNQTASVIVDHTMSDDEGLTSNAALMITISGDNDAPVLSATPVVRFTGINEDNGNTFGSHCFEA